MPLLLDAAGLLTAQAQLAWRSRAPISEWWPAAVEALRARPFIPVDELTQALEHVALAFAPPALQAPSVQRFRAWAGARAGQVASLSEVLRAIAVAPEGHYVAAPLQEALLTLLIGPPAVATLARLIETLRARPFDAPDPPPPIRPGDSADAAAPAAVRPRSDAQLPLPAALTGRADPVVTAINATPAVRPSVHNLQGALPGPPAGSAPPDVENPAELDGHRDQALPDPDSSRVADADTSLARLAAQATSHSRAGGRGRRGGRGRGRSRGRRLADDDRPAPAPEADTAADGPALNREGTAAQRRVAAAEDGMRIGLAALDDVCLEDTFRCRTLTLQGVPARLRGALRTAMRTGLELISERTSPQQELRGWKLFLLAPRMLLHRAAGQARIPPAELALRCEAFARGEWVTLLHAAARTAEAPHLAAARSAAQDVEARAHRAAALVHLGELSAAGRALTAEPLAPATDATLAELRDPVRRPPEPYGPLPSEVASYQPQEPCPFPLPAFLAGLRKARRGAAAGPSGATNEHLRILLDDEVDSQLLHCAAQRLAQADVPAAALAALRVGRIVALQKPDGRGVRALVVGDVLRRLVGRALAQAFALRLETACLPYQYGLSTRSGAEALPRVLRAATEVDPRATILSVDAVGAYDHVSRQAMLAALHARPELRPLLPYARQFYGAASAYTWTDGQGASHSIVQGEGGEQGDPLMPALFSLAQHPALEEVQGQLRDGEAIFAYLDDTYIIAAPERIHELHLAYAQALWAHARIELNSRKTRVWNAAGEEPPGLAAQQGEADNAVWVGDWTLPPTHQGLTVLGTPFGSDAYVQQRLALKREEHDRLLQRIPSVPDLQAAWLLLHYCAVPRANYLLRSLPPAATAAYASSHDAAVSSCFSVLLGLADAPLPPQPARAARLALRFGGLGLRAADADRHAAYWASWMDTLPVIQARVPSAAERLLAALRDNRAARLPSLLAATQAAAYLTTQGYAVPSWDEAISNVPGPQPQPDEPADFLRGWQRRASHACDERALETHLADLSPASRALLLSQAGPHAARAFTVLPTSDDVAIPDSHFRVLLLRRLRMPLPLGPRNCSCRGMLDAYGDHRAACSTSGVLASRALPLERAIARVCQEAGARVGRNVALAAMNIDVPVHDARRIEVVCNGLPLWHGAQLAVDATLVSPVTRDGRPHDGAEHRPGWAVRNAARRKRRQTYPEIDRSRRCRLVVFGLEVGGRWAEEAATFVRLLARARAAGAPAAVRNAAQAAWVLRWSGLISVAAQRALAATFLELPLQSELAAAGPPPALHELLADARWQEAPEPSRLPARA